MEPSDENVERKHDFFLRTLRENGLGSDLAVCLFVTAALSYRPDRCVRPFPPYLIKNDEKDFNLLRQICNNIPPINDVINNKCSNDVVTLLTWLLVDKCYPVLKPFKYDNLPIKTKRSKSVKPQYVFELIYQEKIEELWQARCKDKETFYAYHGSSIDNFYSIIKNRLQQNLSLGKELLYGTGIYLSNEISVSMQFAPFGITWNNSVLGQKQSIVAVCETICDNEKVISKDSSSSKNGVYGKIPKNYFVVQDSDLVRVKYLLVYSSKKKSAVKSFLIHNFFWILLALYAVMLVLIGMRGTSISKWLKWISR